MANPNLAPGALTKDPKGTHWIRGRERRKAIKAHEDAEKEKVRRRDRICRWPHCANCRLFRPRLECAHLVAKGMGGDAGLRSDAKDMVLLDFLTHQSGTLSLEQHGRHIVVLDADRGADGPLEFWQQDDNGQMYLVAREVAPFVYARD
jgi:hypothetical protein